MNLTRIAAAIGALTFAVTLTACGAEDPTPATKESSTVAPAVTSRSTPTSAYVAPPSPAPKTPSRNATDGQKIARLVYEYDGTVVPADFARDYAEITCEGFENGLSILTVIKINAEAIPRFTIEQHAAMVGASNGTMCPELDPPRK